ncbi:uncharacterized protein LOC104864911 [Fukomys damarensis]|uniref:uncharacterized protein LOC104864911 n=1 Tax=Fukomys damarensis TaxID=885580 RepID=UPI00053FE12D|nr:uncharacterized protein LOC104864911 [Fukomys damarensis]
MCCRQRHSRRPGPRRTQLLFSEQAPGGGPGLSNVLQAEAQPAPRAKEDTTSVLRAAGRDGAALETARQQPKTKQKPGGDRERRQGKNPSSGFRSGNREAGPNPQEASGPCWSSPSPFRFKDRAPEATAAEDRATGLAMLVRNPGRGGEGCTKLLGAENEQHVPDWALLTPPRAVAETSGSTPRHKRAQAALESIAARPGTSATRPPYPIRTGVGGGLVRPEPVNFLCDARVALEGPFPSTAPDRGLAQSP